MRKLIALLWVVFLPITSIVAQSNEDKQETYDQLKEWAVVKLTIAYMEDLYSFTPEEKGSNGNNKEYDTYKGLYEDYFIFSEGIDLDEISEILITGDWSGANKEEFYNYKKELVNSSDYNNFGKVIYTPQTTSRGKIIGTSNRTKALKAIDEKFDELVNKKNTVEENSDSKENKEEDNEIVNRPVKSQLSKETAENTRERSSSLPFWVYGILGSITVTIIIIFTLIHKIKKLKRSTKKETRTSNNSSYDQDFFSSTAEKLRGEIMMLKITENSLNKEIESLNKEIEILKNNTVSAVEHTNENTINDISSQSINVEAPQQNANNLIYLSSPFQNLTFANEDASKDKTLNSLYQVEFNDQMQTGELSVLTDTDLSKALNSPDTYLETACTYDNEYSNNARAIKVIEKGEIKLEGEDWIVTKKVRIKFI